MVYYGILQQMLGLEFYSKTSLDKYEFTYSPGKEIDIVSDIFKENMILRFDAYGNNEDPLKRYSVPLKMGLFKDTSFLIIKIYNLDNKKYRKKYCRSKEPYVVDFHKNGLYIDTVSAKCK